MAPIAWLAFPLGATLAAIGWVAWISRPNRTAHTYASLRDHERFRVAMEHSMAARCHSSLTGYSPSGDTPGKDSRSQF